MTMVMERRRLRCDGRRVMSRRDVVVMPMDMRRPVAMSMDMGVAYQNGSIRRRRIKGVAPPVRVERRRVTMIVVVMILIVAMGMPVAVATLAVQFAQRRDRNPTAESDQRQARRRIDNAPEARRHGDAREPDDDSNSKR